MFAKIHRSGRRSTRRRQRGIPFGRFFRLEERIVPATTLRLGDMAITGYASDDPDKISIVLLRDVSSGAQFTVTDEGWLGAQTGFRGTGEGETTFQFDSAVPAGTQISLDFTNATYSNGITAIAGTADRPNLSATGDSILIYSGGFSNRPTSGTSDAWITGINMNGNSAWDSNAIDTNTCAKPTILVNGNTAFPGFTPEVDNAVLSNLGAVTGSPSTIRTTVYTASNWTVNDATPPTIPGPTTFAFSASATVTLDGSNNLVVDAGSSFSNNWVIRAVGANYQISDANSSWTFSTTIPGSTGSGTNTLLVPITQIAGSQLLFNAGDQNDAFTVDFSGGNFSHSIVYDGGSNATTPGDSLKLTGGSFATLASNYSDGSSGSITLGSNTIQYSNIEPIDMSGVSAADIVFNLTSAATNSVVLEDEGVPGNNVSRFRSTTGTVEQTDFATPTNSLTIVRGLSFDSVSILTVPDFNRTLTVGSALNPFFSVSFNGPLGSAGLASGFNVSAFASSTIDLSLAESNLTTTGSGAIVLSAPSFVIANGASLTSASTGSIAIVADSINIGAGSPITAVGGPVSLAPKTNNQLINLGGTDVSGTLGLSASELALISAGTLAIGSANSGAITVSSTLSGLNYNLSVTTGAGLAANQSVTMAANKNLSLSAVGGVSVANTKSLTTSGTGAISLIGGAISLVGSGSVVTAAAGGITLAGDSIDLSSTSNVNAGSGAVTLKQKTANQLINLGGADSAGTLGLTNTEIGRVTAGTLKIGDANSGTITVNADIVRAAVTAVELASAGDIAISAGQINTGGGALLLHPGASGAMTPTKNGIDATASSASLIGGGRFRINGVTVDSTYDQLNVTGSIDLTSAVLQLSGSYIPANNDMFTIVSAAGGLGGTTFSGRPEGSTIDFNTVTLTVHYTATSVQLRAQTATDNITLDGSGNLVVDVGDGRVDDITLALSMTNDFVISDSNPSNTFTSSLASGGSGTSAISIPIAAVPGGQIKFLTGDLGDALTISFSNGNYSKQIVYDGGSGSNRLTLADGTFATLTSDYIDGNSGSIDADSNRIDYSHLAPIDMTDVAATDLVFQLPASPSAATLAQISGTAHRLSSAGSFEQTDFTTPSGSVAIIPGSATDSLTVGAVNNFNDLAIGAATAPFAAVEFIGDVVLAGGFDLSVDSGTIALGASISLSGSMTLNATDSITQSGGTLTADAITLSAESGDIGANASPVVIDVATVTAHTAGGDLFLHETGLASIGAGDLDAGAGTITLDGGTLVTTATGSILSSAVVRAGATLAGDGSTAGLTVQSGGTVSPGSSPSTLHTGSVAFNSGSHFAVEINGPNNSDFDNLAVNGTVDLGGAQLDAMLGFTPTAGRSYTIIDNNGTLDPVAGHFFIGATELSEGAVFNLGGFDFQISYAGGDGNDVAVRLSFAPAGTDGTVMTSQDTPYTFTVADFGFTDPNDVPANSFVAVTVTTLPAAGTLKLNGVAVVAGQSIAVSEVAAGHLQFVPGPGEVGTPYATFTFQVQDDGVPGHDLDPSPNTMTINVNATALTGISNVRIGDDTATRHQRSRIEQLQVTFSKVIDLANPLTNVPAAFTMTRLDDNSLVMPTVGWTINDNGTPADPSDDFSIATLTFGTQPNVFRGSLVDGNYQLHIDGGELRDLQNHTVDADGDNTAGGTLDVRFYRFFGDLATSGEYINPSNPTSWRTVDFLDLAFFRTAYGTLEGDSHYDRALDYDADGDIDAFDLAQFRFRLGRTLDPV